MHSPQPPIDGALLKARLATDWLYLVIAARRYLRITVAVISLVACMLLIALWVRSYWWSTTFTIPLLSPSTLQEVVSTGGRIRCYLPIPPANNHLSGVPNSFVLPYWFPVLFTAVLAAALGIRRPFQFSLRTLLIAMTIIAVWLGLIVSLI